MNGDMILFDGKKQTVVSRKNNGQNWFNRSKAIHITKMCLPPTEPNELMACGLQTTAKYNLSKVHYKCISVICSNNPFPISPIDPLLFDMVKKWL